MYRIILLVNAGALLALAEIPVGLWPQIAIGPPGTNNLQRTEVVPGTPGGVAAVVTGGVVGVPMAGQQPGTTERTPGGVPSIVTGPSGSSRGGTQGAGTSGTGTAAPLQSAASRCDVKLTTTRATLGPVGGPVEIAIAPLPPDCKPAFGAAGTWLQLASGGGPPNVYRFSAAPNTSPVPRTATVVIGGRVFTVEQAGLIRTRLAASPPKITIGLSPAYNEHRREVAIWADKPSATLAVTANVPWLRVEATRSRKPDARTFEVIVDSSKVPPGVRQEGAIVVSADGAPPFSVPVVVERFSRR